MQESRTNQYENICNIINNTVDEYYNNTVNEKSDNGTKLHYKAIHTEIEASSLETFKQHVIRKHGKLHSAIGKELTKAIQIYNELESIKLHHKTFSSTKSWKLREDVALKIDRIKKRLYELHNYPEVHTKALQEIIREVLGKVDYRTFNKYYIMISRACLIKHTGLYGSLLDVENFVGQKKIEIDVTSLAPTEEKDKKLI